MKSLLFLKVFILLLLLPSSGFSMVEGVRDLYFEIHNKDLKAWIERKVSSKKLDELYCSVYWIKGRKEVVVQGKALSEDLKELVKESCEKKSAIVAPLDLEDYLKPFRKEKNQGDWKVYKDDTGVHDINEVLVKQGKDYVRIVEKRPTGTTKIKYSYAKMNNQKVLAKVSLSSYEGIQNVSTETTIRYQEKAGFPMPVKAEMKTSQNLVRKEIGDYTRKLEETSYFKNYKINKSKALLFFSKR